MNLLKFFVDLSKLFYVFLALCQTKPSWCLTNISSLLKPLLWTKGVEGANALGLLCLWQCLIIRFWHYKKVFITNKRGVVNKTRIFYGQSPWPWPKANVKILSLNFWPTKKGWKQCFWTKKILFYNAGAHQPIPIEFWPFLEQYIGIHDAETQLE